MARSRTPKFDASEVITNEIVRIIERGVLTIPDAERLAPYLVRDLALETYRLGGG